MPIFNLEYALAVFQEGVFTFAAKEHRQVKGSPQINIDVKPSHVEWTIFPLTQGVPDTNNQAPQKNRFDLYILLSNICMDVGTWPTAGAGVVPSIWGAGYNNTGTQRIGGKSIKMTTPVGRLSKITSLVAEVGIPNQPFTAEALDLTLFADIEHTPVGKLYSSQQFQLHIGFQGTYKITGGAKSMANQVTIKMSHSNYEAIRLKVLSLCSK